MTIRLLSRVSVTALGVLAAASFANPAFAAGYAVKETSATLQGLAYAGAAAGGEDITALFNNPAAIGLYDGFNASANGALILPEADISVSDFPDTRTVAGSPIGGARTATSDDIALVPATYGSLEINDTLKLGIGITAPFGLVTDYGRDWAGRYHATFSELLTINVNPVVAYTPTPWFTIGFGVVAQYAKAQLENAVDFGTIAQANGAPVTGGTAATDGYARVEGDDIAFGGTIGVILRPTDRFRFGVSYRSEIEHDLEGDVDFDTPAAFAGLANAAGLVDQSASAQATTPAQINIGASFDVTDRLTVAAEADWTQWSSFEELRVNGDVLDTITVSTSDYQDSWFLSVGASYQATDKLKLRLGFAFDEGAATDEFRTPRIPDSDRYWLAAGLGYELWEGTTINLAYTYVAVDDGRIDLSSADPENTFRGDLSADAEGDVHLFLVNGVMKF